MKIVSSKEVYRCKLFWVTEDEAVDSVDEVTRLVRLTGQKNPAH